MSASNEKNVSCARSLPSRKAWMALSSARKRSLLGEYFGWQAPQQPSVWASGVERWGRDPRDGRWYHEIDFTPQLKDGIVSVPSNRYDRIDRA
jgi:hypothetical protein